MERMIDFYNKELMRFSKAYGHLPSSEKLEKVDDFIDTDSTKIAWTRALKRDLALGKRAKFDERCLRKALYRPFTPQWMYFHRQMNEMIYQMPKLFPTAEAENLVIGVSASQSRSEWSVLISDRLVSLHTADMVGSQWFPLYVYEGTPDERESGQRGLAFGERSRELNRRDGISDDALRRL